MKGKPKGIRRKLAKENDSGDWKTSVSLYGELAKREDLLDLYSNVELAVFDNRYKAEHGKYPNDLPKGYREKNEEHLTAQLAQSMIDAIKNNDVEFFETMAAIARWRKEGRPAIDARGLNIIHAGWRLIASGKKPTAANIVSILEEQDKQEAQQDKTTKRHKAETLNSYDEADIRRIIRELGIKWEEMK